MVLSLLVNRSDLVGHSKSKTSVLEALAETNALNYTGRIDYNEFGTKDEVGLVAATEKFVDNFLLKVLVPDYNVKNGRNTFVGPMNRSIRALLERDGLSKCTVKAVGFSRVTNPENSMIQKMPYSDDSKEVEEYYMQEYKIACPNVEYATVMSFLRSGVFNVTGMSVKDIDVTVDYSGSFNKHEIVQHLVKNHDFRVQGSEEHSPRTIIDNDNTVGRNCLSYMETVDDIQTRPKIYNKFVQMVETQSVRSKTGCHWKDWVAQKGTRLAKARDLSSERGLTRAEVTFYIDNDIPSDEFISNTLSQIEQYIPKSLVYSTPFVRAWETYCNSFKHSLVCVDLSANVALIVYSYNELTNKISGQIIENWYDSENKNEKRWKYCLSNLTLNGNLPLDIIEASVLSRTARTVNKCIRPDQMLEVTGTRYFKVHPDHSTRFKTRIVSKRGCYSYNKASVEENDALLAKAGLLEHTNCVPYLATSKASSTSKADATLCKMDEIKVQIGVKKTVLSPENVKEKLVCEAAKIDKVRSPLLEELQSKKQRLQQLNDYIDQFKRGQYIRLRDMEQNVYDVTAVRKLPTQFGYQYQLAVSIDGEIYTVWANKYIASVVDSLSVEQVKDMFDEDSRVMTLYNKPLGKLTIMGRGTNSYGTTTVYCRFVIDGVDESSSICHLKSEVKKSIDNCNEKIVQPVNNVTEVTVIPRESLLAYKEYDNLTSLPLKSTRTVTAIGKIPHYRRDRLVVRLNNNIVYQAGEDLERKENDLKADSIIRVVKVVTNRSTRT